MSPFLGPNRNVPFSWPPLLTRLGFGQWAYRRTVGGLFFGPYLDGREVFIPLWTVILAASVLPIGVAWKAHGRRRAVSHYVCAVCGCDLRATRDRCPECGTAIPQKTEARA